MLRHNCEFHINIIAYLRALSALRKPGSIADIQSVCIMTSRERKIMWGLS